MNREKVLSTRQDTTNGPDCVEVEIYCIPDQPSLPTLTRCGLAQYALLSAEAKREVEPRRAGRLSFCSTKDAPLIGSFFTCC